MGKDPLRQHGLFCFAQLINDPGGERGWGNYSGQAKEDAQKEREELFKIIRDCSRRTGSRAETKIYCNKLVRQFINLGVKHPRALNKGKPGFDPDKLPAFHDPFAGGGAIPFEAQRLGLEAHASDLNPVAVMINKAMIEIPPKFPGRAPVGPVPEGEQPDTRGEGNWPGAKGLSEDFRRYGHWMRKERKNASAISTPRLRLPRIWLENDLT